MAGKPERVPESYRFRLGTGRSAYPRRSPPRLRSLRFETGPRLGEFLKATRTRGAGDANIGWATGGNRTEPPVKDDGTPTLAERQMGEFLKQMPKATGALREGSAVPERNHGEQPPTLADLNITKKQSHVAQKLATIPEPEFRERIAVVVSDRQLEEDFVPADEEPCTEGEHGQGCADHSTGNAVREACHRGGRCFGRGHGQNLVSANQSDPNNMYRTKSTKTTRQATFATMTIIAMFVWVSNLRKLRSHSEPMREP